MVKRRLGAYAISVVLNVTLLVAISARTNLRDASQAALFDARQTPWAMAARATRLPALPDAKPSATTIELVALPARLQPPRPDATRPRPRVATAPRPTASSGASTETTGGFGHGGDRAHDRSDDRATEVDATAGAAIATEDEHRGIGLGLGSRVLSSQMRSMAAGALGPPTASGPRVWNGDLGPLAIGPRDRAPAYEHKGPGTQRIGRVEVSTSRSGKLAFRQQAPVDVHCCIFWVDLEGGGKVPVPGIFGVLDLNEVIANAVGVDLYYAKKLRYADDTREARIEMRQQFTKELAVATPKLVQQYLVELWRDAQTPLPERREALCRLWREASPSFASDEPDLKRAAADAQRTIMRFIRQTLPQASPEAFTTAELAIINRDRPAGEQCWPYGAPEGDSVP